MRVIKFRGKRIGRWVYGFFVGINPEKENISHIISRNKEIYEVYSETVGQFTGLTDNKGKEIYEGIFYLIIAVIGNMNIIYKV